MKHWLKIVSLISGLIMLAACGVQAAPQPTETIAPPPPTETPEPTITPTPEPYWPGEWVCFAEVQMTEPLPFTLFQEGNILTDPDAMLARGVYQLEGTISEDELSVTGQILQGGKQMTTFVWQRFTDDSFIGYWDAVYSEGDFCCARPGVDLPEPCGLEH